MTLHRAVQMHRPGSQDEGACEVRDGFSAPRLAWEVDGSDEPGEGRGNSSSHNTSPFIRQSIFFLLHGLPGQRDEWQLSWH
ncbi:hypothetical protein TRIP_B250045 [uncultured Desulfatiglans sp.]|uniref:Uncharacterized protein n=1 Tax=Uncultured Desulfatiglans sp. TaxID=1748965 RepID=A0A653A4R6_UNCDX|nr:hypothetical protein TRIP_B250045 [uncultured Desulfatiglans sp.]